MPQEPDIETMMARMTIAHADHAPDLWDEDRGVFVVKIVDGRSIEVMPLMFTAAVIVTPLPITLWSGYTDRWCYGTVPAAVAAAKAWDGVPPGEPDGWHRHPSSGRRRPNGDPAAEYICR